MTYQVQIEQIAPQTTAVVRCQATHGQLAQVVPQLCGEVWEFARAAKLPRPGRHLAIYFDGVINLEVGVEVTTPFAGIERVVCSQTPAGMVAKTAHFGPYQRLGEAHAAICQWCKANGHIPTGINWEVYGHWHDDPAQLRTDVYYLLQAST